MAAERQGWNTWDRYLKAGIVDDTIMFTDNQIIIDHAIGKTKQTIGKCYPIDAAVAYSLASAGPNADLSAKDLVNQYTRAATAMMSQTVAYGRVPNPDTKTCGHDEVSGFNIEFNCPVLSKDGITLTGGITMLSWLKKNNAPDVFSSYASLRTTSVGMTSIDVNYKIISMLLNKKYTPLRLYIEKQMGTTRWGAQNRQSPFASVTKTKGVCLWKDDNTQTCGHHDGSYITDWVMIKKENGQGFKELWSRERGYACVSNGWNNDQIQSSLGYNSYNDITPDRVILWNKNARSLGNIMEEKRVVKQINGALRRMSARNFNVVRKEGLRNKARYTWKNWDWLFSLQNWIAQTSKKNRKEHDLVNGWLYTKYDSRRSYGHEIASFKWTPGKVNDAFVESEHGKNESGVYTTKPAINDKDSVKSYHVRYKSDNGYGQIVLPYRFPNLVSAANFKNMSSQLACKLGAVNKDGRTWDGASGNEAIAASKKMTVGSTVHTLEMDADKEPEVIPSPKDVLKALLWGTPQDYDKYIEYLNERSASNFSRPTIINKPDVEAVATE
tara:strand:+ start:2053 stop:3714 length:1662 start_codon:yes stop_codon:yes gene_type:complete